MKYQSIALIVLIQQDVCHINLYVYKKNPVRYELITTNATTQEAIGCLSFSPDAGVVAVATRNSIMCWATNSLRASDPQLKSIDCSHLSLPANPLHISFSPDGRELAVVYADYSKVSIKLFK